jgi:predicted amidohydrolase
MNTRDGFRLALAQPSIDAADPEARRVDDAVGAIADAASQGAHLLLFPESYPGPISAGGSYDAEPRISEACRAGGIAACWGRVEEAGDGSFVTVVLLTGPDGRQSGRYVRSHPATGNVHPTLSGAPMAPGSEPGLFELEGLRLGVTVCSELWNPELCRVLALRGAEVLLAPAGGGFHSIAGNWKLIARARAIENGLFVGLTQQLFGYETGAALIAGPEVLVGERGEPGLLVADLDLERARWLRAQDDSMAEPKPFRSIPGLLRARRPDLYGELTEPRDDLYDYNAGGS